MEMLVDLLANGTEITFTVLFVTLLLYVIKQNDSREKQYQTTIDQNQQIIGDTVKALNGYEELKEQIKSINEKIK